MRFNLKNSEYYTPEMGGGILPGAFVKDDVKVVQSDKLLQVSFKMYYSLNGEDFESELGGAVQFTDSPTPTLILNDNEEPQEILDFITSGGSYDKSRISDWGVPSAEKVRDYFNLESIWSELEFREQPLKLLAVDWLMENLEIGGHKLGENFELEQAGL